MKGLAVGAVGSVSIAGYAERQAYSLRIERHTLKLPRWDADGFRVAVIADPHVNFKEPVRRGREAAELALKESPDVIVFVGDYINHSFDDVYYNVNRAFDVLFDAKCPVYGILGNHDYAVNRAKLMQALAKSPIRLLKNDWAEVEGVSICGMDDAIFGTRMPKHSHPPNVSRSILTLLHEPDYVVDAPQETSLLIGGHSHGGQMCLPFGRPISLPHGAKKYYAGFYPDAEVPVYVSRGVGTIGIDLRSFCPPELSVLTLVSG